MEIGKIRELTMITSSLDKDSRDYFDIRLFSVITYAAQHANDEMLHTIFNTLTLSISAEFPCRGVEAIKEGKAIVEKMINACVMKNFMDKPWHIQQYGTWIISEFANTADFSGILRYQKKQLDNGADGVTKEGVIQANKIIIDHLEKYKSLPSPSFLLIKNTYFLC